MNLRSVTSGAFICAVGLIMIIRPAGREELEQKRKNRIAEIAEGSPERFFEERRSLETYLISKWTPKSPQGVTAIGVIVIIAGLLSIGFGFLA